MKSSLILKKDGKPALTRKTAVKYGQGYVAIVKVCGGYAGFLTWDDYNTWKKQM